MMLVIENSGTSSPLAINDVADGAIRQLPVEEKEMTERGADGGSRTFTFLAGAERRDLPRLVMGLDL